MKREVIEDLFEENYASGSATFKNFADAFGGTVHGDEEIHNMIIDLHDFSLSTPYPDKWLDSLAAPYNLSETARLENIAWFKEIIAPHIAETLDKIFDNCAEAQALAEQNKITVKAVAEDAQQLDGLKSARGDWDKLYDAIWAMTFKRYNAGKGDPLIKDAIKNLRDDYKAKIISLRDNYFLAPEAEMIAHVRELFEPISELIRVTKSFAQKFAEAKRERGIIDFADMEHFALKIFDDAPEVAAAYRNKFKFIMVDEYQDTNGVQEAIIQKISRGDNLFCVGDVKQSMTSYRCINLSKNFRSREKIISAVNEIF